MQMIRRRKTKDLWTRTPKPVCENEYVTELWDQKCTQTEELQQAGEV
jgi:hypothetical protein